MEYVSFDENNNLIHSQLTEILNNFTQKHKHVQGQMVVTFPAGVPIAQSWDREVDPILIGAIAAAVKLTFQNLCKLLKRGQLDKLYVKNEFGKIIIQNSGAKSILTTIMDFHANDLEIAFRTTNLAKKVQDLMWKYKDV